MTSTILITGAAGWLGSLLANALLADPQTPGVKLVLVDIFEPKAPSDSNCISLTADLSKKDQVDTLFTTKFGIPDTVYCLHGIMSRGSEDDFDLGTKINVDSVRLVLEAARFHSKNPRKFIFASSLAVYGGPLPDIVTPSTIATPQSSYGFGKLTSELMINEYHRRGWIDGRILRLPTILVRPGAPSKASSSFISGIIREPISGLEAVCPVGNSIDSPELSMKLWLASPQTTIKNFIIAKKVPAEKLFSHTRVICLPGFTASVRDELDALLKVAGQKCLDLVKYKDDPVNRNIVSSWPSAFDNSYPLSLGFIVDEGGMEPIVRRFLADVRAGAT